MSDLKGGTPADWIACGWFTPDYSPLAETFAANLTAHGAPFHLFARQKLAKGWSTLQKPSVVLSALDAYPDKTVVLMDIDCRVDQDIAPVTSISGDVGLTVLSRWTRLLWPPHPRLTLKASSRVVVFRPTEGARLFADEWERQCKTSHDDEVALGRAFLCGLQGVSFSHLNPRYSAIESLGSAIGHDSANAAMFQRPDSWLKTIEKRYFRTGRTNAAKSARPAAP